MDNTAKKHDVYQAIADPTRRKVMELLAKQDLAITDIAKQFPISRTAIVKHLHILSEAKLVTSQKNGREKLYTLSPEPLADIKEWISYYERFWGNKLSMLKHLVESDEN
ncbi:helix-turn-helix transcriptional regulator [Niallia sp. NCCP-28]|uniref:ArsR/SmtB family transcription factor n=1 Tax=Niallia sp. NCCP-28 TaxID=2934712 RepID=UPI002085DAA2|nr:metalloregulator ArsR/SmtB family transcription factor [Niallia sp. NCCP-28]GKU81839.1 transcriptional regulator [Niallia sp. NCCP-28]